VIDGKVCIQTQYPNLGIARTTITLVFCIAGTLISQVSPGEERNCGEFTGIPINADARALHRQLSLLETALLDGPCEGAGKALRTLASRLYDIAEFGLANIACGLLSSHSGIEDDDTVLCARPLLARGEVDEAIRLLRFYVKSTGESSEERLVAVLSSVDALEDYGLFKEASEFLGIIVSTAPDNAAVAIRMVTNLLKAGRIKDAVKTANDTADAIGSGRREYLRDACHLLVRFGQSSSALPLSRRLVKQQPFSRDDLDAVLTVVRTSKDKGLATTSVGRFIDDADDGERPVRVRTAVSLLERHGMTDIAASCLEKSIASAVLGEATDWLHLGRILMIEERFSNADDAFEHYLSTADEPVSAPAVRVADIWIEYGKPDRAVSLLKKNTHLEDRKWVLVLGRALNAAGDHVAEWELYEASSKDLEDEAGFWMIIGERMSDRQAHHLASQAFLNALDIDEDDERKGLAHMGLAEAYMRMEDIDQSDIEAELMAALEAPGTDDDILDRLQAVAHEISGSGGLNVALLKAASRLKPDNPKVRMNLARAFIENDMKVEAFECLCEYVTRSGSRSDALLDGVQNLFDAGFDRDGIRLAVRFRESGVSVATVLSEAVAVRCIAREDLSCASDFIRIFLDRPLNLDYDYNELGRKLVKVHLHDHAQAAFEKALKVTPPDLAWRIEMSLGVLGMARGDIASSGRHFERSCEESPRNRAAIVQVGRQYQLFGALAEAARWFERAMKDSDGAFRIRVFPMLADVLAGIGDEAGIRDALDMIDTDAFKNAALLNDAVTRLVATNLVKEAADLVRKVAELLPGDQQMVANNVLISLLLRLGRGDEAFDVAARSCTAGTGERFERACLIFADRFMGAMLTDMAVRLLVRCAEKSASSARIAVELAADLFMSGDFKGGLIAAEKAAGLLDSADLFIKRLGPLMSNQRLAGAYLELLKVLKVRRIPSNGALLEYEIGRISILVGKADDAVRSYREYVEAIPGAESRVYRDLASAGLRREAAAFIADAPNDSVSRLPERDLRDITLDLLRSGRPLLAKCLLLRFAEENEGIEVSKEVLGRIYHDIGWQKMAIQSFSGVRPARLTGEGLRAYLSSLAAEERLDVAVELVSGVADAVQQGDGETNSDTMSIAAGFLADHGKCGPVLSLLERGGISRELSPSLRLRLATVAARCNDRDGLRKARRVLLDVVDSPGSLPEAAVDYLRFEIRNGTAGDLLKILNGLGTGPVEVEAALTASCLLGDMESLSEHSDSLLRTDFAGLKARTAAFFRCGMWEEAFNNASRALAVRKHVGSIGEVAGAAVITATILGIDQIVEEIDRGLGTWSQDRFSRLQLLGMMNLVEGDYNGLAAANVALSDALPNNGRQLMASVESSIWSGDAAMLSRAVGNALQASVNRVKTAFELGELFTRVIRYDLVSEILKPVSEALPGDRSLAWRLFTAALGSGMDDDAVLNAHKYLELVGRGPAGISAVIAAAAKNLSVAVVEEFLDGLMGLENGTMAGSAMLRAGTMFMKMGDTENGFKLINMGARRTADPEEFLASLAYATIKDPEMPVSLLRSVVAHNVSMSHIAEGVPLANAARCLDSVDASEDVAPCVETILGEENYLGVSIMLDSAKKALGAGSHAKALVLLKAVVNRDRSAAVYTRILDIIATEVWPGREIEPEIRKGFRRLGLALVGKHAADDINKAPFLAHIMDLEIGEKGVEVYERHIALAPSHAGLRNNMAYILSVGKKDCERAIREARLARKLSSTGDAFYMETEAWALFLLGRADDALSLQEEARRLWSLDQGGGLSESFYHLGRMQEAVGRQDEAAESYRKSHVLEPFGRSGHNSLIRYRALYYRGREEQ